MKKVERIALSGLFASFSLLLSFIGHYLVIPMFLGFKLDISDFPIFTSTLLFGSSYGYIILFAVSFIRTLSFSIAGWPGFFMRFSSFISIFFLGLFYKKKKKLTFYSLISIVSYILLKIPISYIFWTKFNSMSHDQILSLILPVIIPCNLIRIAINVLLSIFLYKKIKYKIKE